MIVRRLLTTIRRGNTHFLLTLFFCLFFFPPHHVSAEVVINEVAWMGTSVSATDEWIELFNSGTSKVDLDGWLLTNGGGVSIALSGSLSGGAYLLLERTNDETVPGMPADLIYQGALGNGGETLTLRSKEGALEDSVEGGAGWAAIGGDNATKDTAQRSGTSWITGEPTPRLENASAPVKKPEVPPKKVEKEGELRAREVAVPVGPNDPGEKAPQPDHESEVVNVASSVHSGDEPALIGEGGEKGRDSFYVAVGGLFLVIFLGVGALFTGKMPVGDSPPDATFSS